MDDKSNAEFILTASLKIDALIQIGYEQQSITPNPAITDETFLRRIYLDIAGRVPTIEEAERFHASTTGLKREQLIGELLNGEGYVHHFYHFWADILRINAGFGYGATVAENAYRLWLKESLRSNLPYDQFVTDLVTSHGKIWENGAIGYYMRDRGMPLDNMSNTVRIFLGTRLECAQCHDHPFDKWTQMDYFKMAAFSYGMDTREFGKGVTYDDPNRNALERYLRLEGKRRYQSAVSAEKFPYFRNEPSLVAFTKIGEKFDRALDEFDMNADQFVALANRGIEAAATFSDEYRTIRTATAQTYNRVRFFALASREKDVQLPHDYAYSDAKPKSKVAADTMFGAEIDLANIEKSPIDAYGEWMTSRDNPTFTKVIANRLWKKVFGHGIFEPIDELTEHTFVSNPGLLTSLENLMRDLDYDIKVFLAVLYNTKTYQRMSDTTEVVPGTPYYFPGPRLRRMTAEQIWDSIIGLTIPQADYYQPLLKSQLASVERVRRMHTEIEGRSWEEYFATMKKLGGALKANYAEQGILRLQIHEAKKNATIHAEPLQSKLSELQAQSKKVISEVGFRGSDELIDGEELIEMAGMDESSMKNYHFRKVASKLAPPPADGDKKDFAAFSKLVKRLARASELRSPAPLGHFLREFGQSDREVIENAVDSASVPQALNLLNGTLSEAISNRYSVLGFQMSETEYPDERIRMIFQALLTREPTAKEFEVARAELARNGNQSWDGLLWALLNTRQFLFIQ